MGLHIRDDRQMKALTGLSHDHFHPWLPVCSDLYQATQQQTYEEGLTSGTRVRKPGGGCKGQWPMIAEQLLFVLSDYKTSPTCDGLGTQLDRVRSKAHANLHQVSPLFYDTLAH
jgi:hypothetical protein